MTISTARLLRHMAWANQRVFASVQTLPTQALDSFIVNEDWTVKKILEHIVSGADWFLYCLRGGRLQQFGIPLNMTEVEELSNALKLADAELANLGELDDEMLTIKFKDQIEQNLRSTIISQAIYHAIEHRSQLVGALEFRGYNPIILDDLDLWEFENFEAGLK